MKNFHPSDVQDILSKLSSDKAKNREDGIKLLNSCLEGESSISFCKFLSENTALLKPGQIPHDGTWPFLIRLLIQCISLEISSSKKRMPKLIFAKTLRLVVQRTEDAKLSGKKLFLLSLVRTFFSHIWDVLRDVPSFQSEYGIILRHLYGVSDYRFHIKKRVYCGLVLLYMEKVEVSLSVNDHSNPKEEVFRCILTLHSLVKNPPGDFSDILRDGIVKGVVRIFNVVRDEGKISRKLLEFINTFLLKDGPNLGCQPSEIHNAVQQFVFRYWLTTHDRGLKDALISYAKLQLKLINAAADRSILVEQLLDVIVKDLDQINSALSVTWSDYVKDDKFGTLTSSQCRLVELAAFVLYLACVDMHRIPPTNKRARREHISSQLREELMKGKWIWSATFCCLIHNYHARISKDFFIYWFHGICASFQSIFDNAIMEHAYDGLLWTLRSLQQLISVLSLPVLAVEDTVSRSLYTIWSLLIHGLPIFSNVSAIVDVALVLLGNIICSDMLNASIVPRDMWDLQIFKRVSSLSVLYFICCYFSRSGSQGDFRENLLVRRDLLRAVLDNIDAKEFVLNEIAVVLIPGAVFALCASCVVSPGCRKTFILLYYSSYFVNTADEEAQIEKPVDEHFDCSLEVLTKIHQQSSNEVIEPQIHQKMRLPRQIRSPLLSEVETHLATVADKETEILSDVLSMCALLSNFIHGAFLARLNQDLQSLITKLGHCILQFLERAVAVIEQNENDVQSLGRSSVYSMFDDKISVIVCFKNFVSCPLFIQRDHGFIDLPIYRAIVQSIERFLMAMVNLYVRFSESMRHIECEEILPEFSYYGGDLHNPYSPSDCKSRIVDMELDMAGDSDDVDLFPVKGHFFSSTSETWKLNMLSLISCCFQILPAVTWEILFGLLEKENEYKVSENIICTLCEYPFWSLPTNFMDLIHLVDSMIDDVLSRKLQPFTIISAINSLIGSMLSLETRKNENSEFVPLGYRASEQSLEVLGNLVSKVAEFDLTWIGRMRLIDSIHNIILLRPQIGQTMIERLFLLLRDPDYRVRLFLARRISVLFLTWEGHDELFNDICSNFGISLIMLTKGKLVTSKDVLSAGTRPRSKLETIIISLMHVAVCSEMIEFEAVFMMCAVSAANPCLRELIVTVLDNLSKHLHYSTRFKYLEELMGSIIFSWVACGVSLAALVEIRDLFILNAESCNFLECCCPWLLPALILHGDRTILKWVSVVCRQPLETLVKRQFVPLFSICMGLHCSKKSGSEKGVGVLQSEILHLAQISENERDILIKTHMVSIVSCILSLASCSSEPAIPFFSRDTLILAVQTVVDGFLEKEESPKRFGVIDNINIFRPDRVFRFILELHHHVATTVHDRHKCCRLAGVEVLVDVLGHRTAVSSTSIYLFNLVGQFINCHALQDQCCRIILSLLRAFKNDSSKKIITVLGEQLQFLVSKLVSCCIPVETHGEHSQNLSQVISLLHQLTVDSHPSLHEFVRELEPFPDISLFDRIRKFHQELCVVYCPRDHFLKFVKRARNLPPRLLLWSLKALHKKLMLREILHKGYNEEDIEECTYFDLDDEIVLAVWNLVYLCGSNDARSVRALASDFLSRVGIGDPHCVVFHLPGVSNHIHVCQPINLEKDSGVTFELYSSISEELLIALLRLLKKQLMDESVTIIDITSQSLRGILSTERGHKVLMVFDCYERSLLEVHSKGYDINMVEKLLLDLETKFKAKELSLEVSNVWSVEGKTFESWICFLVYTLIGYCTDTILRLCQDIVLLKAEIAELLLPSVFINIAGSDFSVNICELISLKLQEHIFIESNGLMKSIQVLLNAMNELRLCHAMERIVSSSRYAKPLGYNSKSRPTSARSKDFMISADKRSISTSLWNKVYWLSIDYLVIAKLAVSCGSYFTSVMYVEYWCEEHFNSLSLGTPDFSHLETMPQHIQILLSAITKINEPDSLYGIIQSNKLSSQIITSNHEGNWGKALEYYDLQVRSETMEMINHISRNMPVQYLQPAASPGLFNSEDKVRHGKSYKGIIKSLQQIGCTHLLDLYCQGLNSQEDNVQHDLEFTELQYEAAWRAGNWDFSSTFMNENSSTNVHFKTDHFNENLHFCLRALQEGSFDEFNTRLDDSKQDLLLSIYNASEESTEYIYSTIIKLQIFDHLGNSWNLRWTKIPSERMKPPLENVKPLHEPAIPTKDQLFWLNADWRCILRGTQLHMTLLEPFIAFRRVLLQILGSKDCIAEHFLQAACILRKGSRYSQAAAALHEFKILYAEMQGKISTSYWLGRLEEAKLLHAQGQCEMAINLATHISENYSLNENASNVFRLVGKWLAENRSSNSRTILEKYLKRAVSVAEDHKTTDSNSIPRISQMQFSLAHYADGLFRSFEERLSSSEWHAAMRLRKHKTTELDALIKRLRSSTKGDKTDYSVKIQELRKQLAMDKEEAEKLQEDSNNFLCLALEGYKHCLVIGDKYDVRVVFRLVSLWFSLSSREIVVNNILSTIKEVQSYKFIPLVYQIASRIGCSKDGYSAQSFQFSIVSLVKKMSIDHPYHTIFQLLALANGDRIKDKQRSKNSFVVDMDKKHAAENLLNELSSYHGAIIGQMKQMVEIYIKLAELETRREETNKKVLLPRDIRSIRQLELVPVVTSTFSIDHSCQYGQGFFPHFKGLADSVTVMNGVNAPKVVECLGSDGHKYRQLAKSGNDDLRQDAVMEQFFSLVNTFLHNHRDTCKRRLGIRTYKVVPFTPSAGVLEWVSGTLPLGEYLIGSMKNAGAHGRYGIKDWPFPKCREHMANAKDKCLAFQEVCEKFRPVMHYFFLEKFLMPAEWFEKRLAYTRSVAASSMVGYIVGLGDRHSMNILIDQVTAEVVHIDLGVAFEQGLMLKTPERVPFRLTRDIIDGMGVTGVEGVFRRCCEETLSVMRMNKEALLTIIEVFIHDPLYKWALSPLKALQRQKELDEDLGSLEEWEDEHGGNKDAARSLLRVKQKLDGYEEGEMRSVHGQVQQLIQDAIDPDRLCQMYPGWGAWL